MSSIETVEHKPTTYAEVKTDTVFNNGFTVKIKTYTDFNTAVVQIRKTASFAQLKTLHHPLISEITIEKDGILIFDKRIDRAFYTKHNALTAYTASNSITQAVTVNQEATSFETNAVYLSARYTYPDQNDSIEYELKVNATGHYSFKKLEYHTQTI